MPSSSASTAHHSWNAVANTRSRSATSSIAPSSALAERAPLAVAVGVEPDPVEPELERDLEQVREALLRVGERLHLPRRRVAVLLVPAPRGDEAMARLADDREQVGPVAQAAVVAERRPQPDAVAAEVLADQLRGEPELLARARPPASRGARPRSRCPPRGSARRGRRRGCRCAAGCRRAASPPAARSRRARAAACGRRERRCTARRAPRAAGRAGATPRRVESGSSAARYCGTSGPMKRASPSPTAADSVS